CVRTPFWDGGYFDYW
nr:immunoglobulin heavy chain junction region [Mus musculus]